LRAASCKLAWRAESRRITPSGRHVMGYGFRGLLASVALASLAVAGGPASAHPHAWIDRRTEIVFGESGAVDGLRQTWTFDEYYTIYALDGLDEDQDGVIEKEVLDGLLKQIMGKLGPYRFFTDAKVAGETAEIGLHPERSHGYEDGRFIISFEVTFPNPIAVAETPLVYGVFDPTYYIEILHEKGDEAVQLVNAPAECHSTLVKPEPSFEMMTLAASADVDVTANDTLGAAFAERVTIACD